MIDFMSNNPQVLIFLLAAIAMGIQAVFAVIGNLKQVKELNISTGLIALQAGVQQCYDQYVRDIKAASVDGKLDEFEREQARNQAIAYAKEYASEQGVDILKTFGRPALNALIGVLVKKLKGGSSLPGWASSLLPKLSLGTQDLTPADSTSAIQTAGSMPELATSAAT